MRPSTSAGWYVFSIIGAVRSARAAGLSTFCRCEGRAANREKNTALMVRSVAERRVSNHDACAAMVRDALAALGLLTMRIVFWRLFAQAFGPRETRSISARTRRSTIIGRL